MTFIGLRHRCAYFAWHVVQPTPEHHHAGGYGTSYPAPLVDPKLTDLSIHNHIYEESQDFHNPILDSEVHKLNTNKQGE